MFMTTSRAIRSGRFDREPHAERAAPVLHHDRHVAQVELVDEALERRVCASYEYHSRSTGLSLRPKPK